MPSAPTTSATPSHSWAAGGVPRATLMSTAETGTKLRKAVPATTPSVRMPKLKARMAITEGTTPMYSRAGHQATSAAASGAGATCSSAPASAAASSSGQEASAVRPEYSSTSSEASRAAPRV